MTLELCLSLLPLQWAMYSDIFLSILVSITFFPNAAQDLLNGFHNSLMGYNTQLEACCPQGLNNSPPGIHQRYHRTFQSTRESSKKIDPNSSKGPHGKTLSLQKKAPPVHTERPAAHRLPRK